MQKRQSSEREASPCNSIDLDTADWTQIGPKLGNDENSFDSAHLKRLLDEPEAIAGHPSSKEHSENRSESEESSKHIPFASDGSKIDIAALIQEQQEQLLARRQSWGATEKSQSRLRLHRTAKSTTECARNDKELQTTSVRGTWVQDLKHQLRLDPSFFFV